MRFRTVCSCLFLLTSTSAVTAQSRPALAPASTGPGQQQAAVQPGGGSAGPAPAANCFTGDPAPPTISNALADGTTEVSGTAAQPSGAGCSAQVELWLVAGETNETDPAKLTPTDKDGNQVLVRLGVSSNVANNQFDVKLTDALLQGQRVYVKEVYSDKYVDSANIYRVSQFGNWGRVKAYFTSGFLLSQDQGSFSQSNLFLAFTLDKTWKMPGGHDQKKPGGGERRLPGFNTFFDTRLTAIPVTACTTSSPSGSSGSGSGTTACAQTTTTSSGTTTTALDTFLSSNKTARLGIGVYLPYIVSSWTYRGAPQSLFIAPLAEAGVDTPVSSITQTQPASAPGTSTTGTVTPVNPTTFYNHYGYGARIGHYSMTKSDSEAPESISYLDVILGRFSNLESFVQEGTSANDLQRRLYRVYLEGILKVPGTPLIVGFSANVGQEALLPGNIHIVQRAGDDLRFLFGARFDVAKLVAKIGKVAP